MKSDFVMANGQCRMNVTIWDDHEAMSKAAADCITRQLKLHRGPLLCLATGSTPLRTYELVAPKARKFPVLFDQLRVLKLDEWEGLPASDPGTSESILQRHVVQPWGVSQGRFVRFVVGPRQPSLECKRIEAWLARNGPIDLCVLGLGRNGHIGFNEPGRALCPVAHRVRLSKETRAHEMVSHTTVKPTYGLTLGMAEILQARRILLLVSGAYKRKPLRRLLQGEISTEFPASLLHLHPHTTILCDRQAWGRELTQLR